MGRATSPGSHEGFGGNIDGNADIPVLRLYVAGTAPHSTQALANIRTILGQQLGDEYDLDVVDVLREPARALRDGVLVTPTLVRLSPPPVQTIVGDLSAKAVVLRALGFAT